METDTIETTVYDEDVHNVTGLFDDEPSTVRHRIPVPQQLTLLAIVLLLLFGGAITPHVLALLKRANAVVPAATADSSEPAAANTASSTNTTKRTDPFADIQVTGKAAIVWDVNNERALYTKHIDEPLPLASVTKLMTALLADELLSATSTVSIGKDAIAQDGNSGLLEGERFDRQTLTDLTLMVSSNDGAYALAVAAGKLLDTTKPADAFVNAMNVRAQQLGLSNTYYKNPTGLDITTTEPGSKGSVHDMALLMEYIIKNHPGILSFTKDDTSTIYSNSGFSHDAKNTNYDVSKIPGLIGSKTGYTDLAGGNLIVAFDAGLNRPIVIAVLGSTEQDRFTDVLSLVHATQAYVTHATH